MGVTRINLGDITERKCTEYGLAHRIPPDFSVRHMHGLSWQESFIFTVGAKPRLENYPRFITFDTTRHSMVSNFWWCETIDTASLTMVSTFPAYVPFDEQRVSHYWRKRKCFAKRLYISCILSKIA